MGLSDQWSAVSSELGLGDVVGLGDATKLGDVTRPGDTMGLRDATGLRGKVGPEGMMRPEDMAGPGEFGSITSGVGGVLVYTDLFFCSSLAVGVQPTSITL